MKIDVYPLSISRIKVAAAKDFFPVLNTFVVPIFPEPTFLISFLRNTLVRINPKGIDPKRYEYIATIKSSTFVSLNILFHHLTMSF